MFFMQDSRHWGCLDFNDFFSFLIESLRINVLYLCYSLFQRAPRALIRCRPGSRSAFPAQPTVSPRRKDPWCACARRTTSEPPWTHPQHPARVTKSYLSPYTLVRVLIKMSVFFWAKSYLYYYTIKSFLVIWTIHYFFFFFNTALANTLPWLVIDSFLRSVLYKQATPNHISPLEKVNLNKARWLATTRGKNRLRSIPPSGKTQRQFFYVTFNLFKEHKTFSC